jgi:hypothetical protein
VTTSRARHHDGARNISSDMIGINAGAWDERRAARCRGWQKADFATEPYLVFDSDPLSSPLEQIP